MTFWSVSVIMYLQLQIHRKFVCSSILWRIVPLDLWWKCFSCYFFSTLWFSKVKWNSECRLFLLSDNASGLWCCVSEKTSFCEFFHHPRPSSCLHLLLLFTIWVALSLQILVLSFKVPCLPFISSASWNLRVMIIVNTCFFFLSSWRYWLLFREHYRVHVFLLLS